MNRNKFLFLIFRNVNQSFTIIIKDDICSRLLKNRGNLPYYEMCVSVCKYKVI